MSAIGMEGSGGGGERWRDDRCRHGWQRAGSEEIETWRRPGEEKPVTCLELECP